MYPRQNFIMDMVALAGFALMGSIMFGGNCGQINGYPASIETLSHMNNLGENHNQAAEQDFRHFIHSKDSSDPTVIGEIKPNASEMEMMVLRTKIASAIMNMQESEKSQSSSANQADKQPEQTGGECFIEVTKVERIPGKCHRVINGLPICQAENYMAINTECT